MECPKSHRPKLVVNFTLSIFYVISFKGWWIFCADVSCRRRVRKFNTHTTELFSKLDTDQLLIKETAEARDCKCRMYVSC